MFVGCQSKQKRELRKKQEKHRKRVNHLFLRLTSCLSSDWTLNFGISLFRLCFLCVVCSTPAFALRVHVTGNKFFLRFSSNFPLFSLSPPYPCFYLVCDEIYLVWMLFFCCCCRFAFEGDSTPFFWLFRSSESAECAGRRVAPSWSPLDTFYTSNEGKKMKIYIIISPVFLFLSDKKFLFNFFTSAISLKGHWKSEIEVWGKLSAKCV